ncbi:Flowering time control protein FPA [Camellia lanceoleosa]|uniref:Flowering time control protein FPA n=1 Tax=Camellia lanceoleosa TaxID=1840588 RepID=A0ACC0G5P6_9ERIC|nr:Flowering time control protein FPA [Camellia lanceoleosa]
MKRRGGNSEKLGGNGEEQRAGQVDSGQNMKQGFKRQLVKLEEKITNIESENKVLCQQAVSMAPNKILSGRSRSILQEERNRDGNGNRDFADSLLQDTCSQSIVSSMVAHSTTRPEFLDYTARTGLDMLAKHYHQAASAWVVFFVPGSDGDIGFYNEFMHYPEEKRRAAVVKLDERTTLFLVPLQFSAKVLKVPGQLSISSVILRLEHSGSNLRSSLQHPNEKIDTNFMPYHGDTSSGPFTPLPPFPNMGKSGVSKLSFLGDVSTASPASLSGSAHAIGSTSNPANENRHDYMLHQQNPTFVTKLVTSKSAELKFWYW